MLTETSKLLIISGNANPKLAREIATSLGVMVGNTFVGRFNNGETQVIINESVRGKHVFIIQPICKPVNDSIMELLIIIDAAKRASAGQITAVIPYYGYARQDRKTRGREPITAKLIANLLTTAGITRVITMDLHAGQIQGFFDIPVDHLPGVPILADYIISKKLKDIIVVSPDLGGVTRARLLADRLHAPIAIIEKRRPEPGVAEVMNLIGNVANKTAIIIDDIIDTASSIVQGAAALSNMKVKAVYACCTHAVLSFPSVERIEKSNIKELIITNTLTLPNEKLINKIKVLSVAPLFAEAIVQIYEELSVSKLFDKQM